MHPSILPKLPSLRGIWDRVSVLKALHMAIIPSLPDAESTEQTSLFQRERNAK